MDTVRTLRERVERGEAAARFAAYGIGLRKGLVKRDGPPLAAGEIVSCACGATYNTASKVAKEHAGH